jgi:hypothetical protein
LNLSFSLQGCCCDQGKLLWARYKCKSSIVSLGNPLANKKPDPFHTGLEEVMFILRDENDRKQSIRGQISFIFIVFSWKQNQYDIVGNEYGTDILVISKTIAVDQKNTSIMIGIYENDILKNDKHGKS